MRLWCLGAEEDTMLCTLDLGIPPLDDGVYATSGGCTTARSPVRSL